MGGVEQAKLHPFKRGDIVDKLHTHAFQRRSSGDKAILDHPLGEGFAYDGAFVIQSEPLPHKISLSLSRCRRDPIDHAIGKADRGRDPICHRWIHRLGEAKHRRTNDVTVMLYIVTAQYGDWPRVLRLPLNESLHEKPEHRLWAFGMRQVVS